MNWADLRQMLAHFRDKPTTWPIVIYLWTEVALMLCCNSKIGLWMMTLSQSPQTKFFCRWRKLLGWRAFPSDNLKDQKTFAKGFFSCIIIASYCFVVALKLHWWEVSMGCKCHRQNVMCNDFCLVLKFLKATATKLGGISFYCIYALITSKFPIFFLFGWF